MLTIKMNMHVVVVFLIMAKTKLITYYIITIFNLMY